MLIRYVVQDDSGQLAAAKRLIGRCIAHGQSLFVPVTVTLELEWVLRASFGYAVRHLPGWASLGCDRTLGVQVVGQLDHMHGHECRWKR